MSGHDIKALILDMGGVLLRTESQEPRRRLAERLGVTVEELYRIVFDSQESRRLQLGEVGYQDAWSAVAERFGLDERGVAEVQREMFSADRFDHELVSFVKRQKGKVKTALLSNAGKGLRQTLRDEGIEDIFDQVIISAEVGLMKPDPAIYQFALDRLGIHAREAVFVDDSPQNVEAAIRLGMVGIQFTSRQQLLGQLAELLPEDEPEAGGTPSVSELTIRRFSPSDLPLLTRLINAADRVDDAGYATTERALAERLARPDTEPTENLLLAQHGDKLVGYVLADRRPESDLDRIGAIGIVHPEWRRRGVGMALMRRVEQRARDMRRDKPLCLEMVARGRVSGAAHLAQALGMEPVRYFFYMQCSALDLLPEPSLPPGTRLRYLDPERDAGPFIATYNDAFSDHWGYVPATLGQMEHWLGSAAFIAENAILAVDSADTMVGFCVLLFPEMEDGMLKSNPPIVDDLGVVHGYRRRGLGRALLLTGMRRVRQLGHDTVALAVDADNPNKALRLYESVGFKVVSRSTAFRKPL